MSTLRAGRSSSPIAAPTPANAVVEPPAADVPSEKAKWSGIWSGWACQDQVCDTKLVVEKVTATGAAIIYAFASSQAKPSATRVDAQFVGDELQATFPSGVKIAYRMRRQGDLEFFYQRGSFWVVGILSKDK